MLLEKIVVKQEKKELEVKKQRDIGIVGQEKTSLNDEGFGIENKQKIVVKQLGGEKKFATVRPIVVVTTKKQQLKTVLLEEIQQSKNENSAKQLKNEQKTTQQNKNKKQQNIINLEQEDSFSVGTKNEKPKLLKTVNSEFVFTDPFALSNIQERNRLQNLTTSKAKITNRPSIRKSTFTVAPFITTPQRITTKQTRKPPTRTNIRIEKLINKAKSQKTESYRSGKI